MSEASINRNTATPWHRFLARGFEDTIGRERVVVKSESPIGAATWDEFLAALPTPAP